MKLKFDANQEYQLKAIESVVNIFEGQPLAQSDFEFSISTAAGSLRLTENGIGNQLLLPQDKLIENLHRIQELNNLPKSETELVGGVGHDLVGSALVGDTHHTKVLKEGSNFAIEMETGTGKTYVYLRTIYELNQKYGFKKFIIVVPSVAIRQGVIKNIEITKEHFDSIYGKVPVTASVYNSKDLGKIRSFATNNNLQILILNIDSFNKDINKINNPQDKLSGKRPMEFIASTKPIVIVDEPQNMETKTAKDAISMLNPLCTLRYSATHRNTYNLVYKLTPVDAYEMNLVKKIEVDSVLTENNFNQAYVELISIDNTSKNKIEAKIKILVQEKSGTATKQIKVTRGDDLFEKSGGVEVYREGYVVDSLDRLNQEIEFTGGTILSVGKSIGDFSEDIMKVQVRETIKEHLEKELILKEKGIKVLSLFFIDRVDNYRKYEDGISVKGKLAIWFEEIYEELIKMPKYNVMEHPTAEKVHNGYFSKDRKGLWTDTQGESLKDIDTYKLIMRDKERLLSIDEPLKFIFSHSALREGWDNPNVFQICTLNETRSELKKRQEIGRGLRIPVNQNGERVFENNLNILTVVANESYESFAKSLQTEIEQDFGVEFKNKIKNKKERTRVKLRKEYKLDENFLALWERIKHRTRYQVNFDTEKLIQDAAAAINQMGKTQEAKILTSKAKVKIDEEGVSSLVLREKSDVVYSAISYVPDILGYVQSRTGLTRSTIATILEKSERLDDFLINPQLFLDDVTKIINKVLGKLSVDGIKYEKISGEEYKMVLFESEEIESYLKNMYKVQNEGKTLYDHVIWDSEVENKFAQELDSREDISFYIKLPAWFKIDTPVGTYNPDWALVFEGDKKLYFVAETKSENEELRETEQLKIECGKRHFDNFDGIVFKAPVSKVRDVVEE
ncbi:MAG: DEAD/DEAH box helicase family protein [Patescibacteria group bacterium]